jgi:hypothetical protein
MRGPVSLLSRLALRAPLARAALPLLAAFEPEAIRFRTVCPRARGLHVFARTTASHDEFSKVMVGDGADACDLKKVAIAELKLDAAPNRVRLLREVEGGGAPVPLDSRKALAEQGVHEGSSVLIEVLPSPTPPLPPALPQLTLDANPAATPHVEYRGALGRGWGTSTFLRCALTPSSCLLPCAPTPPSSFRPFAQH